MTMEHPEIFSATLGISPPWLVTSVEMQSDGYRLDIIVDFANEGFFFCPNCGASMKSSGSAQEIWHHSDFFRHDTYLHARVPKVTCLQCGETAIERPWSRAGSRFLLQGSAI
jgi:transposase